MLLEPDQPLAGPNEEEQEEFEGECDQTIVEILDEAIRDLVALARKHQMTEGEIDEAFFKILAERLEGEDDEYVMQQYRIAKADLLRNQIKLL